MTEQPKKNGWMRDEMPATAAFIDELRRVFGVKVINESIRKGMRGEPGHFYAEENGKVIGTKKVVEPSKCLYIGKEGNLVSYDTWLKENQQERK